MTPDAWLLELLDPRDRKPVRAGHLEDLLIAERFLAVTAASAEALLHLLRLEDALRHVQDVRDQLPAELSSQAASGQPQTPQKR